MTFDKKLTIAVLFGSFPLVAVTLYCATTIAAARGHGGGGNVILMTMLCSFAYAFACLVLIPTIGLVLDRTYRLKLPLARRPRVLTGIAAAVLVLPLASVNALFYLLVP